MVQPDHAMLLQGGPLVGCDQIATSIAVIRAIRDGHQVKKLAYSGIDLDHDAAVGCGAATTSRVRGRWKEAVVSKPIWHGGDRCGCFYLAEPLVIREEERAIMHQGSSERRAELVPDESRDRARAQIKIVPGVERSIPMKLEKRAVELITPRL